MSNRSKFVAAIFGLLIAAVVGSRQLFLFAVFRNQQGFLDSQGERFHLWLAISAGIAACIATGLMFLFFLRHEKNKTPKSQKAQPGALVTAIDDDSYTNSSTRKPFDPKRWALANRWLSEGQADDRSQMNGSVADIGGRPSDRRAFARQFHQVMFKKWSQVRHD